MTPIYAVAQSESATVLLERIQQRRLQSIRTRIDAARALREATDRFDNDPITLSAVNAYRAQVLTIAERLLDVPVNDHGFSMLARAVEDIGA